MRIRKRKVPLPLSLLSPIPLSDPHLFSRSPVMVVQGAAADTTAWDDSSIITSINSIYSQPSDHLTLTCPDTSASDLRRLIVVGNRSDTGTEGVVAPTSNNDDARNVNITRATKGGAVPNADDNNNNTNNNAGRWYDGDRGIRVKKTNNFVDAKEGEEASMRPNNSNENTNEVVVAASAKKGNNKRGNTIMEGSRCSRVNGRGWRCCQPTLVGYSLCEHHLGKGRLRSLTSGGGSTTLKPAKKKIISSNATGFPLGRDERERERAAAAAAAAADDDDKNLEMRSCSSGNNNNNNNNKRVKLGVVKARSLSSLLGLAGDQEHHDKVIDQ